MCTLCYQGMCGVELVQKQPFQSIQISVAAVLVVA